MTFSLRPYQHHAIDHLHRVGSGALFLDMGLGKTASVLSSLTPDHLPALVVAPKRVAEHVWEEERKLWRPDLTLSLAAGTPVKRREALARPTDLTVISRDNFADVDPIVERFRTFIIDESSGFKSIQSQRWKRARSYVRRANLFPHVWEMTGTPSPNGYLDLWAQLYLLDQGERLYPTITKYRQRYFMAKTPLPNGVIPGWDIRPGASDRINELISDICLSMTTEGRVELPEFTVNEVDVPLPASVRADYRRFEKGFVLDLDLLGGELHTARNAAALSGRLSQLSAGFLYSDDTESGRYDLVHREKIAALREIIDGVGGKPVLVFYRFRAEADLVREAFGPLVHTVDEPDWYEEWNAGRIPILLTHPASIGHGLNLQRGGSTVVWTTPDWNLELWDQGNKRLHRSGQKSNVVAHVLCASRMDRTVLRRLETKSSVQEALMEYLESPL